MVDKHKNNGLIFVIRNKGKAYELVGHGKVDTNLQRTILKTMKTSEGYNIILASAINTLEWKNKKKGG